MDLKRIAKAIAAQFAQYLGRVSLARRYIRGDGIEIGALQDPLKVPRRARVRYLDIAPADVLRHKLPGKEHRHLVQVDIVDDGERLAKVADHSQDFVISNHFIEHCMDPVGALRNMLRVLRPGGVVFMSLPDKRFIFDRDRPATSVEHLLRDHREGPEWSHREHYEEVVRLAMKVEGDTAVQQEVDRLMGEDFRIHFHCWSQTEFLELLVTLQREPGFPFDVEHFAKNEKEMVVILRKGEAAVGA